MEDKMFWKAPEVPEGTISVTVMGGTERKLEALAWLKDRGYFNDPDSLDADIVAHGFVNNMKIGILLGVMTPFMASFTPDQYNMAMEFKLMFA